MDNGRASTSGLRIALVAPPMKSVPPVGYGGTERVVASLAAGLVAAGHRVTVYASGDSETAGTLEPIVPRALWDDGYKGDTASYMQIAAERIWKDSHHFDIIHSHLEGYGFLLSRYSPTPVVSTLHGRLDDGGMIDLLARFEDIPLVAISDNQRRWMPDQNWVATVPHGLPLETMPHRERHGDYLVVVGRISPEKGIGEAIELAARTNIQLRIAAKLHRPEEYEMFEAVVKPAIEAGSVSYLGELQAEARDPVLAGALATLMLGGWPEPFGLVAIESLAAGTPVIARRAGALPEIIEPGVDGFIVDDLREAELALRRVPDLDRALIRKRALERFSVERMTRDYEAVYAKVLGERATSQSIYQQHDPAPIPIGYHVDGPDLSDGQRQVGDPSRIIRRRHRPAGASRRAVAPSGDRS